MYTRCVWRCGDRDLSSSAAVDCRRHRRKALELASQIGILYRFGYAGLPQALGPAQEPHDATVTPG
eukprot:COSAG04_NODE_393_length_15147_cov_44.965643_7_plen_66_part_00